MTQGRATHQPEPDDDLPPLPPERKAPQVPADALPALDEEDPPDVPADDVPELPHREALTEDEE